MHQCIPVFWNAIPKTIAMFLQTQKCQPKKSKQRYYSHVCCHASQHWNENSRIQTLILVHNILRVISTLWQHKNALPWKWDELIDVEMFMFVLHIFNMPSSSNPLVVPHKLKTKDNFQWLPFCYCESTNTFPEQKLHIFQDLLPHISHRPYRCFCLTSSCICRLLLLSVGN